MFLRHETIQWIKKLHIRPNEKKITASDITVAMVINAYKEHGFDVLSRLFGADKNGKICVTNNRKVKNNICDYLKTKY